MAIFPQTDDGRCPSTRTQRVFFLENPQAGSGHGYDRIQQAISALRAADFAVSISPNCQELVAAIAATPPDSIAAVVTAGGDGTLRLAADRLPAEIPLVPFPLGTENLLAKHFGFTTSAHELLQTVWHGPLIRIDAATANGKLFLIMATCGFDAEVVRRMDQQRKGHIRHWHYIKPIIQTVRSYKYPSIVVTRPGADVPAGNARSKNVPFPPGTGGGDAAGLDKKAVLASAAGGQSEGPITCRWAMFFNLPCYAGGLMIQPHADPADGQLDLCGLTHGSTFSTLRYLTAVCWRRHLAGPDVLRFQNPQWAIRSDLPIPFQVDGDYGGMLPLTLECLPQRLTLRLPVGVTKPSPHPIVDIEGRIV